MSGTAAVAGDRSWPMPGRAPGGRRRRPRLNRLVIAGGALLGVLVLASLLAPVIAPADPLAIDPRASMKSPGADALFGTDRFGRDVFSRVLFAVRNSLLIAFAAVAISAGIGGLLGLIGGFRGGWPDLVIGRFMDILFSFPDLLPGRARPDRK
jgi:peptide/nickel transport system permease protein